MILQTVSMPLAFGQKRQWIIQHDNAVRDIAFNSTGTLFATASEDGTAGLWDASTGSHVATLPHNGKVYSVDFSPDGAFVATSADGGAQRGIVTIWVVETGEPYITLRHNLLIASTTFSPDGALLAATSFGNASFAYVWQIASGERIAILEHEGPVVAAAFSPDGTRIATASWYDRIAAIWDVATWQRIATLEHHGYVEAVAFSPDGMTVATASRDQTAGIWSVKTGERLATLRHDDMISRVAFSPDGSLLATAGWASAIWDIATESEAFKLDHRWGANTIVFSSDGSLVAAAIGDVGIWDVASGDRLATLETLQQDDENLDGLATIADVTFSPDGSLIATRSYEDPTVSVWKLSNAITKLKVLSAVLDSVRIQLRAEYVEDLYAWQATLAYDPTVLEFVGASEGDFLKPPGVSTIWQQPIVANDTITLVQSRITPGEASGDGILATLEFKVKETGSSRIDIRDLRLSDESAMSIFSRRSGARVEVASDVSLTVAAILKLVNNELVLTIRAEGTPDVRDFSVEIPVPSQLERIDGQLEFTGESILESAELGKARFRIWEGGEIVFRPRGTVVGTSGVASPISAIEGRIDVVASPSADVNKDYRIDIIDLITVARQFGQSIRSNPRPNPDVNRDGTVDVFDVVVIARMFGQQFMAESQDVAAAPRRLHRDQSMPTKIASQHQSLWRRLLSEVDALQDGGEDVAEARRVLVELVRLSDGAKPERTVLRQNYPNPFNPETWIPFELSEPTDVVIHIYNVRSELVRTVRLGRREPGIYESRSTAAYWDGRNETGEPVSSGVYLYELQTESTRQRRRMVVVR
ncbi:MAG: cohesin domain-containing protein [Candidatus Poribacteria bacterium]|nr:cohesin domain-containing protein [Candidatus Poribacteria bacterium]